MQPATADDPRVRRSYPIVLLHFSRPVDGSRHYVDRARDLTARLAQLHAGGDGPPLLRAAVAAGVDLEVAPHSCATCQAVMHGPAARRRLQGLPAAR
jgi:hypothetical protein